MSYQALYRVWRPQTFTDVVGQSHITKTLQNALLEDSYSHAYLFTGPRGTGKTSAAKIMAKAVNCERAPIAEPCNECSSCTGITQGTVVDVVEIDAASNNGVDEIRDLRDKVKYAPTEVKMKVYIIDEVHMLSQGAFNALLKTLEEPPDHVMFILATTEPHKIPLTIISRCQRFDFRRISNKSMLERLVFICEKQEISIQEEALHLLVQVAEGGMRDALSLLDQSVSFSEGEVTLDDCLAVTGAVSQETLSQLADAILQGKVNEAIRLLDVLMDQGKEPIRLVEDLIYFYRDMLLYQTNAQLEDVLERAQLTEDFQQKAQKYPKDRLFAVIERLSMAQNEMKWTNHPRVFLEVAFIQVVQVKEDLNQQEELSNRADERPDVDIQKLVEKIETLEQQLNQLQSTGIQRKTEPENSTSRQPSKKPSSRSLNVSQQKIKEMLTTASKAKLQDLTNKWAAISEEIKKKKITVHAWLMDGEPVACSDEFFLIAFKNAIHRETTERESHRQIIEQVVREHVQSSAKMITIMYNEWSDVKEEFIRDQKGESNEPKKNSFYDEAVQLVGEDLVEVIEKE